MGSESNGSTGLPPNLFFWGHRHFPNTHKGLHSTHTGETGRRQGAGERPPPTRHSYAPESRTLMVGYSGRQTLGLVFGADLNHRLTPLHFLAVWGLLNKQKLSLFASNGLCLKGTKREVTGATPPPIPRHLSVLSPRGNFCPLAPSLRLFWNPVFWIAECPDNGGQTTS